jgi:DNA repair exonuclease SbcCD ATPase subunit
MGYRGEDLDLRTPQTGSRSASDLPATELGRPRGYGLRGEPIWVDDTVLACCNLAFDLAATHRSGEVRIEHLIYAMTRIDAAAEILEARGVRVAALRREMGIIVASEIPIGLPNGKGTPRRSEELETLLREAADLASRRSAPANIDDLVAVLAETSRELPGIAHLRRHLAPRAERDYDALARVRDIRAYSPAVYEPRPPATVPVWAEPSPSRTDSVQNSRIEALEQAVRALGSDLSIERKTVSNLLLDIQRDVGSRRDEESRLGGGVIDRLGAVEHAIEKRLADMARSWGLLHDRLQSLEQAVVKVRPDTGVELVAVHDRLNAIERALQGTAVDDSRHWTLISDRLKALEQTIGGRPVPAAGQEIARLGERFDMIEHVLLERASEATTEAAKLAEKLKAIEEAQAAQKVQALQLNAALAAEVNKLSTFVSQQQLPGAETLMPALNERFQAISMAIDRQRTEIGQTGLDRLMPLINERFQVLGAMIERQRGEAATALTQPIGERLNEIGSSLEARQAEGMRTLTALAERIGAIERGMTGYVQKVSEQSTAYDEDIHQIQDALIKINTQQAATAGTLEQWRQQGSELGIISNRLAALERLSMRPAQMMEQVAEKVDAMYKLTAVRIEKRNRFYYWLFGTDSWLAASWPSKRKDGGGPAVAVAPPPRQASPPPVR